MWVNCGHCSECRQQKQMEWTLRTYYECLDTIQNNGTIYFDSLTYRVKDRPRISNYIETNENWACFNPKHIREFYEALRQRIGDKNARYFIVSEYGDIRKAPHYHIMLFLKEGINTIEVSDAVSKSWKYGRTDGIPYRSEQYIIAHNTIKNINLDAIRYIAKYVSKQQTFIEVINKRWEKLEKYYNISKFDKLQIKKIRQQFYRVTTPFHRQSQHYGETALYFADLNEIFENNRLYYKDDSLKINAYCSLPTYFKRKLFQQQIKYNGKRMWINNELGTKYKQTREKIIIGKLWDRLNDLNKTKGKKYEPGVLYDVARYIIKERGRMAGNDDYKPHHKEATYYNYNTDKDLIYIGKKGISKNFIGNDKIGYCTTEFECMDIDNLIYINNDFERIIEDLQIKQDDKALVLLKEHMNEIRKIFFSN